MSQDALRVALARVDGSAPGIQNAASAMMKHYDRSASVAVNEWRNCLATCSTSQLLPLLYVANEVLQNSKRNRGNKFLEAMSPVLGQSLRHICSRDPNVTEKVRRTAKIWGDRRVFSIRFVNEILQQLEEYRHGKQPADNEATFSPQKELPSEPKVQQNDSEDDSDEDIANIMREDESDSSDDDDDEDIFASTGDSKLQVDFTSALAATSSTEESNKKRRRSSLNSTGSSPQKRRSSNVLSPATLLELWTRLQELTNAFDGAKHALSNIDERHAKTPASSLENLVGDELQHAHRQNENDLKNMQVERRRLHEIAQERHELEKRAVLFLPWLEKSLNQDEEDIQFCDMLEMKIKSFADIHKAMKNARDERRAEEQAKKQQQAEQERKKKEKEEQEMFRKAALSKETEAKPGMVWNPTTREYQFPNTDESWRE